METVCEARVERRGTLYIPGLEATMRGLQLDSDGVGAAGNKQRASSLSLSHPTGPYW